MALEASDHRRSGELILGAKLIAERLQAVWFIDVKRPFAQLLRQRSLIVSGGQLLGTLISFYNVLYTKYNKRSWNIVFTTKFGQSAGRYYRL